MSNDEVKNGKNVMCNKIGKLQKLSVSLKLFFNTFPRKGAGELEPRMAAQNHQILRSSTRDARFKKKIMYLLYSGSFLLFVNKCDILAL
jgi:hypothetical protein